MTKAPHSGTAWADRELVRMFREQQRQDMARQAAEQEALESFVPTPRPSLIARAVQAVLGPPPIDDPVHGRRALTIANVREALGLDQQPKATAAPTPVDAGDGSR